MKASEYIEMFKETYPGYALPSPKRAGEILDVLENGPYKTASDYVSPGNRLNRKAFREIHGVTLPPSWKGTHDVVMRIFHDSFLEYEAERKARDEEKEKEKEEARRKAEAELESVLHGFLKDAPALRRHAAKRNLEQIFTLYYKRERPESFAYHELVMKMLKEGVLGTDYKYLAYRLVNTSEPWFMTVSKTQYDYANYMKENWK